MSDMLLWPSHYKMAQNSNGEYLNGEGRNGPDFLEGSIQKAVMASNGFFYYTDDVIKSKYFETVYAEFLINPAFSWLDDAYSTALKTEFMKSKITSQPNVSYTLCLTPNTVLAADGFVYNSGDGSFTHSDGANVSTRLDRIIRQGVFSRTSAIPLEFKETFPEYNGYGFAVNQYGDMIRYRNENDKTYLQAIGNIIENQEVELTYNDTYNNGFVYTVDKALEYSARNTLAGDARWNNPGLYEFIQEYVARNPEASLFLDYLKATRVSSDGNISGVGTGAYTILFPSNESIQKLIDQGVLVEPDSPKLNQTHAEYD
ncbi:MAG: hypothetical protein LIO65_10445, partial [Odoribacter sp.]|nr:hypothetical protein [Odoribacter sp.]